LMFTKIYMWNAESHEVSLAMSHEDNMSSDLWHVLGVLSDGYD
jgi:hypothetical protein